MTTPPSSLRRASSTGPKSLLDDVCQRFALGDELGRGGEGSVYELASDPSLVAKVYHKTPLDEAQLAKLRAMTAVWSAGLEQIAAWPRQILYDPEKKQPAGLLMSKMSGALALHELYGTTNRRRHFPTAGWHHLVLAARNVAAAFDTFHRAKIVVGDVNQGNLLVDTNMTVRMIDCDSFQITHNGQTYNCPVGSPHFTPPELQGLRLRDVIRTEDHDRFGLATLIFHLLFVGRHPFAGRYRGAGDMSIEKAISERRFAFSRNKAETMVDPPPDSLLLEDLPLSIGSLFEAAFRTSGNPRPSPKEWMDQLDQLIRTRRTCTTDKLHVYPGSCRECPWCRIEDRGGPSFFFPIDADVNVASNRLGRLEIKIVGLEDVQFPQLAAKRIAVPVMPPVPGQKPLKHWGSLDIATAVMIASWVACVIGMLVSKPLLIGATVASIACAGYLLLSKKGRENRDLVADLQIALRKLEKAIGKASRAIDRRHRQRLSDFLASVKEFEQERTNYRAEREDLAKLIEQNRQLQFDDYLRDHSIRDHYKEIRGLTPSHVTVLESYDVESAFDLARLKLYGVPTIDSTLVIDLLAWGAKVRQKFVFKPEHGLSFDSLKAVGSHSVQRYKMAQAQKVLMGDERLRMLAQEGKESLDAALKDFDVDARDWQSKARQLWNHEKSRSLIERTLNRAPVAILLAPAVLVPAIVWLMYWVKE